MEFAIVLGVILGVGVGVVLGAIGVQLKTRQRQVQVGSRRRL